MQFPHVLTTLPYAVFMLHCIIWINVSFHVIQFKYLAAGD